MPVARTKLALSTVAITLLAAPLTAQSSNFGCGLNPVGSLFVASGSELLGSTLVIGLDNPLGTQPAGAIGFVLVSAAPDLNFPCGSPAYGLSMQGVSVPGELLVDIGAPNLFAIVPTTTFQGAGQPAFATLGVPSSASLAGVDAYLQGVLLDVSGLGAVTIGASEGLKLTLGAACSEARPCIAIDEFTRRAYSESRAFDYEYDGGVSDLASSVGVTTDWQGASSVFHQSYEGSAIGTSSASQSSRVGAREITAQFATQASTFGNLFQEDAQAQCDLDVAFDVPVRVRFQASATGTISGGYGEAWVTLAGDGSTRFALGAYQGQSQASAAQGWLQPGSFDLDAGAVAFAYGYSGAGGYQETHTSGLDLVLTFHHQCDFDGDGDVDADDSSAFHQELDDASLDADIDGDGDADSIDGLLFDAAWQSVQ